MIYNDLTEEERGVLMRVVYFCFERNIPVVPTGSRVIGGHTDSSDWDFCINTTAEHLNYFESLGFESGGSDVRTGDSLRFKRLNIICIFGEASFKRWVKATKMALDLRLTNKRDRVNLFETICNPGVRTGSGWTSSVPEESPF